jgi:DNA polymerase III delta prime subunit
VLETLSIDPGSKNYLEKIIKAEQKNYTPCLLSGSEGSNYNELASWIFQHFSSLEPGLDLSRFTLVMDEKAPLNDQDSRCSLDVLNRYLSLARQQNVVLLNLNSSNLIVQNALLKTLEEPPVNTFILLSASNQQDILSTIKSRSIQVRLRLFEPYQLEQIAQKENIDYSDQLILQALGSLERLRWLSARANIHQAINNLDTRQLIELFHQENDQLTWLKMIGPALFSQHSNDPTIWFKIKYSLDFNIKAESALAWMLLELVQRNKT